MLLIFLGGQCSTSFHCFHIQVILLWTTNVVVGVNSSCGQLLGALVQRRLGLPLRLSNDEIGPRMKTNPARFPPLGLLPSGIAALQHGAMGP